jgi:hypothetical protein
MLAFTRALAASAHVSNWHDSEVAVRLAHVCFLGKSGKHLLGLSFTDCDPERPSGPIQDNSGLPQGRAGPPAVG